MLQHVQFLLLEWKMVITIMLQLTMQVIQNSKHIKGTTTTEDSRAVTDHNNGVSCRHQFMPCDQKKIQNKLVK